MITFNDDVFVDVGRAFRWYRRISRRLALRFLKDLEATCQRIEQFPQANAPADRGTRFTRFRAFPYMVYYRPEPGIERVFAVIHERRHARVWKKRLGEFNPPST